MKFTAYVMAPFEDWIEARQVQEVLRTRGYEILNDWTLDAEKAGAVDAEHKDELLTHIQQQIAYASLDAACTATLGVMVCGPHFPSIGAPIEFGCRDPRLRPIDVILNGTRNSVFWKLPLVQIFKDFDSWCDAP